MTPRKRINALSIFILIFVIVCSCQAAELKQTAIWHLPVTLNDQNTLVRYQYVTALGAKGSGKSSGVSGKAWLKSSQLNSVVAELTIPVSLNIFSVEEIGVLGNLVAQTELPPIQLSIQKISNLCDPREILPGVPCQANLEGKTSFGTFSGPITIPVRIERKNKIFQILGGGPIDTAAASENVAIVKLIQSASVQFIIQMPAIEP